jgi:recombination protein RecT
LANQLVEYKKFTFGDLDETMIQTIHETIAKDCTEPQFKLFMTIARSLGANPLLNDIYPTVYQGKLTPQFGIGFYVNQARKHSDYRGYDVQLVHENDEFSMHQEKSEGDERYFIVIDKHSWGFPRGKIIGCYAFAYREGFKPFSVVMGIEEVDHLRNSNIGMQKAMWNNNTGDMFKKHVSKRALNAGFGLGFEDEELTGDSGSSGTYERKEINPDAEIVTEEKPAPKTKTKAAEASKAIDVESTPVDEAAERKQVNASIKAKLKELGITSDDDIGKYMKDHMEVSGDVPTLDERKTLLVFIENQIAAKNDDLPE